MFFETSAKSAENVKEIYQSIAEKNDLMFFETSAKSAENVKEIYQSIAEKLKELHVPVQPTPKKSNCC